MAHVAGRVTRAARAAREKVGSVWTVSAVAALECDVSAWDGAEGVCRMCNEKLPGRRKAWCSDSCHREFELNHIWDEARQHVLATAGWTCEREGCEVNEDLQVNHIDPVVGQGYHPSCYHHLENLEALCRPHHQIETNAQRAYRVQNWTDDALLGKIVFPSLTLEPSLRTDLIRRQLDRTSGFPFITDLEEFDTTGVFYRYRPNTKWAVVQKDLEVNFPEALLWSRDSQAWMDLKAFTSGKVQCRAGVRERRCRRLGASTYCWQHEGLTRRPTG